MVIQRSTTTHDVPCGDAFKTIERLAVSSRGKVVFHGGSQWSQSPWLRGTMDSRIQAELILFGPTMKEALVPMQEAGNIDDIVLEIFEAQRRTTVFHTQW